MSSSLNDQKENTTSTGYARRASSVIKILLKITKMKKKFQIFLNLKRF
jgi:hypothetical protein